ncbi:MAG: hypothetical protein JO257_19280 [Deltaproteobacteria bacterium]|nr:hypothetical protein [Deltaproteobacteria bacterium]
MRWLALVVLASCTHTAVFAQPNALVAHAPDFAAGGRAQVDVQEGGTTVVDPEDVVAVVVPGNEQHHLWGLITTGTPDETRQLTVRNLVAGCPGGDCLAERVRGPIRVGTRSRLDATRAGIGAFGAAATVVSFACIAECRDPGGWAYVGAGLALTTLLVPLATVF